MSSVYPGGLDNFATDKTNETVTADDHPAHHNDLADAVNRIEAELGVDPAGSHSTVASRLDSLSTGAYNIEGGTYVDAGLSDEFNSMTLDAQWTPVNMASGTVNPITANPAATTYDLTTRPGSLLVQLKPAARSYLRIDSFIASGEQIIVSMGIATPGHTAVGNNALWAGIGYNDDDTDPYAGDDAQILWDGTSDSRMLFMRNGAGTTLGVNNFASPPSRRSYYRLMRSSDTVYAFHSMDGIVWSSLNSENTFVDTANNFWLIFDSNGTNWTHAPIMVVNWVRHVANLNFDPW